MMADNDGLILAYILDGNGGGKKIGWDEIACWNSEQGLLWTKSKENFPKTNLIWL